MKTRKQLEDRYEFLKSQLEKTRINFLKADSKVWNGWYREYKEGEGWVLNPAPCDRAKQAYEDAKVEHEAFIRELIEMLPANEI